MTDTFTTADIGKTFYSSNGEKLHLEAITWDERYVVTRAIEIGCDGCGGYEYHDDMFITRHLYRKPPIAKKAKELEDLQKQIADAQTTLTALKEEIADVRESGAEFLSRAKAFPALKFVLDYLEGDVLDRPCVVEEYSDWKIMPLREALHYKDQWAYSNSPDTFKLLTLYGNSKGDLQWRISAYADGSGGSHTIEIASSTEDAEAFLAERVQERIATALHDNNVGRASDVDKKYPGYATPEQFERIENYRIDCLRGNLVRKAEELRKVEGEFKVLKESLQTKTGDTNGTESTNTDAGYDSI